jgi:hypothetical protein
MRETIVIKLAKPLITQAGPISQIILREPTFDEYMSFGDPYTVAAGTGGTPFAVENPEVIRQYMAICLVEPKDPALLSQAGARVAREVKDKILSFFQPAEVEAEAPATLPTSSPSAATASAPPNSKA